MQQNRIVIDCDPGIDDTFALILCIKKLDVAGIVAVGGNTGLRFTSRNARYVTELTGRTDIPVYAVMTSRCSEMRSARSMSTVWADSGISIFRSRKNSWKMNMVWIF